jgi:hypothetical protein
VLKKCYKNLHSDTIIIKNGYMRTLQWIFCSITCVRTAILKHVVEGKVQGRMELMGRRGRRRNKLLVDLQEKKVEIE